MPLPRTVPNDKESSEPSPAPPSASGTPAPTNGNAAPTTLADTQNANGEAMIDPELASLPAPGSLSITESIAQAPNPRPADFSMLPLTHEELDLSALDPASLEGAPGSPTAKLMKAIAPPNAAQPDTKWPTPPPNASVNLFIGRALLSNGNDNWPLKPNDIVTWIKNHYPAEWDGDEGRCSAHRVRTYLARKGTDMYYEKLSQGNISGWRIRQNHIWRFENGGFLGRGMKQEEAIAAQAKENEAIATASHKAAAAAALAAGHPTVKVSMSAPGINDGPPAAKRAKAYNPAKPAQGQSRRPRKKPVETLANIGDVSLASAGGSSDFYNPGTSHDAYSTTPTYEQHNHSHNQNQGGPSHEGGNGHGHEDQIDPSLMASAADEAQMDMEMVQRAMQAAAANAGQMEDMELGMQLPIEMQMHGGEHDDRTDYYGTATGGAHHPYTPHTTGFEGAQYGYTEADGQLYGHTDYQSGQ